jgi:signal transduction histidine kinase
VLQPIFEWTPQQRRRDGYLFLRDEVFPRRLSMLGIADRIGAINESQLNAGKNNVELAYRQARRRLAATLGLTIGLGLLLAAFSMRSILRLETGMGERYREIEEARAELKQLSARLVEAQENERRSISRELHDEIGQALSGILVEMANLSTMIRARDQEAVSRKVGEIKKELENSIKVVRNMALLLRPSMLDDLGLVPALEWQAREVSKRSSIRVGVTAHEISEDLPEEHKTCIYRIVQEALHNIEQHADARTVKIAVRHESHQLLLSIDDDGKGFDSSRSRGMGLLGMHERVSHLGGALEVSSEPGRGTHLGVTLPLPVLVTT